MGTRVRVDSRALGAFAKGSLLQGVLKRKAEEIAQNVRDQGIQVGAFKGGKGPIDLPVKIVASKTDRDRYDVIIAHPAGLAVQAKRGALTKAAAEAGMEVKGE